MLQLGLPEKLRQQAARVGHYEYFEMYSSVCVRSIQDWLTRPKNIIQLPGNTWQYGILHASGSVCRICMHVGAPKHIQGRGVPRGKLLCCFVER